MFLVAPRAHERNTQTHLVHYENSSADCDLCQELLDQKIWKPRKFVVERAREMERQDRRDGMLPPKKYKTKKNRQKSPPKSSSKKTFTKRRPHISARAGSSYRGSAGAKPAAAMWLAPVKLGVRSGPASVYGYSKLFLSLECGIPAEIEWALDSLTTLSFEDAGVLHIPGGLRWRKRGEDSK